VGWFGGTKTAQRAKFAYEYHKATDHSLSSLFVRVMMDNGPVQHEVT